MSSVAPSPVSSRRRSAARMPITANIPATTSPYETPGRIGGPPGSPVIESTPPIACTTMSRAARSRYGPVCPNPLMLAKITRGFRSASTA